MMSTNFAIGIRMALVRRKSAFLSNAPLEVRNDHEVVLTAMQHVPWSQRMGDVDVDVWIPNFLLDLKSLRVVQ